MPSGRTSLYLDYTINGKRHYEYLKLYIEKGNSAEVRAHNNQTWRYAEAIRSQRLLEVRDARFGLESSQSPDTLFFPIFDALNKRTGTSTQLIRNAVRKHLLEFTTEDLTFRDITPRWADQFERHLLNKGMQRSSVSTYLCAVSRVVNYAIKEGIITKDPMAHIKKTVRQESVRCFLTLEELQKLATTPTKFTELRRAFLFSCLTGLRASDISTLTWGQVSKVGAMTRITFRQQKTKGLEYLDINEQAAELMGEAEDSTAKIFKLHFAPHINGNLRKWVQSAGINKHITFHSGRHTFAVMMLDLGTDIYTVQKLLGHRNINTTQIYAKVLDKNKQEAVQRIPKITI